MKVKNVINGLIKKYDLREINIISPVEDRVYYSGSLDNWKGTSVDMILLKKEIENAEVTQRIMFNNRKAFIFIPPLKAYYPVR